MKKFIPITIPNDYGTLDLKKQIEELKKDNLLLAKKVNNLIKQMKEERKIK